jgi:hypothetical protein
MSYYLFLDDERKPSDVKWVNLPSVPWVIVRDYDEFVKTIDKKGVPLFVTYDHDLGIRAIREAHEQKFEKFDYDRVKEKTGKHCAMYLVTYCLDRNISHPKYTVHSQNPIGKQNIESFVNSYNKFRETSVNN